MFQINGNLDIHFLKAYNSRSKMAKEHKYKDRDNYKNKDKDKDAKIIF